MTQNVGLAWYTPDEWQKVKDVSADREIFEDLFPEWEAIAIETFNDLKSNGLNVMKVYIKSDALLGWCNIHSLRIDSSSRSKYVSEILSKSGNN